MSTRSCSPTGFGRLGSSNSVRVPRVGERRKRGEMRTHLRLLVSIAAVLVAVIFALPATAAGTTTCTDVLAPGTYGKVVVPAGATCFTDGPVVVRGGSGPFGGPFDITWNAIEDNVINGGATIENYDGFWMGFIRNTVKGSVNLNGNVLVDPDGNEYVTNTIHGSLNCTGNSPAPQIGDSEGTPNTVTGSKTGQCAGL